MLYYLYYPVFDLHLSAAQHFVHTPCTRTQMSHSMVKAEEEEEEEEEKEEQKKKKKKACL